MNINLGDNLIRWEIHIKTVSESNISEHWTKSSRRHRQQQFFIRNLFKINSQTIPLPCEIILTRISNRFLDPEDNLPMSLKWIKDQIGACIFPEKVVIYKKKNGSFATNKGHSDSDPRVIWKYAQEKGNRQGIRIEINSIKNRDI